MSFVEAALKHRLELVVPWLGVWSQGVVTTLLSPHHTPDAVRKIAELADHVCHYAGHVSTGVSLACFVAMSSCLHIDIFIYIFWYFLIRSEKQLSSKPMLKLVHSFFLISYFIILYYHCTC